MDKEQIIQMARDAGIDQEYPYIPVEYKEAWFSCTIDELERFAAAIRAATKEEDAKICESESLTYTIGTDEECGWEMAVKECASSIRASK